MTETAPPRLRTQMREATADAHARVDALMAHGFNDARGYRAYLSGMQGFVAALLPAVRAQAEAMRWPLPDWDGLLRQDMDHLQAGAIGGIAPLPGCDRAAALGALYVLEGSSLGARLLVAEGRLEREDSGAVPILHLIVRRLEDHSAMLDGLHRLDLPGRCGAPAFPAETQIARAEEIGRGGSPRSAIPRLGRSRDFH